MIDGHDELVLEKIAGLKETVDEIKSDVNDIKKSCACRLQNCNSKFNEKIGFKSYIATSTLFIAIITVIFLIIH